MIRLWDLVCLLNSQCSSQHALEHCQDRTKRLLLKRGSKGFKLAGFAHSSSRSIQWKVTQLSVISVISVKWHDVKTMWRLCDTRSPTVRYGTGLGDAVHCQTLFFYLFLRLNDFGLSSFATLHVSVGLGWSWQVPLESDPGRWRLQSLEGCGSHSGRKYQEVIVWKHSTCSICSTCSTCSTWVPQADAAASLAEQLEARIWRVFCTSICWTLRLRLSMT